MAKPAKTGNRTSVRFRAVILAAGESKRMGAQKLLMPFEGRAMIRYAVEAGARWNPLVVAGPAVGEYTANQLHVETLFNDAPERGMTHSLVLASVSVEAELSIIALLGDKPLVTPYLISRLCAAARDADVVFPRNPSTGEPGHPVLFSPRARAKFPLLPDGDSLRMLRDDPSLTRREVPTEDLGAYFDVDTPL
jgi:molybdenum cofactor cytidylyltransferase